LARLRAAQSAACAGVISVYSECAFTLAGRGSFRGDYTTHPTIGRRGRLEEIDEARLEMIVPAARVPDVARALYAAHSYEEPAFDLYPVVAMPQRGAAGMGRVGVLRKAATGTALVQMLGKVVDLGGAQVVGELRGKFERVVAAAGSFGVDKFCDTSALYVTGEFKHHDALALLRRGVTAVHLGHYASERPTLQLIQKRLADDVPNAEVRIARADRAPLRAIQSTNDAVIRRG
ncbi:MAG: Nif3-like dinuclear metal center hexameric protein, partial [Phycisphaerales bacterium]|nr:Nif3-like dinuclear metal center hexameric protein [Phycisphaerales bacterium]